MDDADSGDTDIAEADANGPDAAHSGTTDVQFGTADIAANPEDPADPQPMDEPSTCEDPPAAPYVQVDNTKKFKVTYHPVPASDDGRALLKTLCSESPPGCDDGKACTRLRFYKPIPLWYAMKIDQDCDQPDAPKITWSVKDAYLRGPPKTKHTVKDFHKAGETVYEGTTNIWKASDAQLAKIKEYLENRHPFNAGLAEMRYKAIAKMQAHLVWHEEQHEAIDIAFLKAQVAIYNDTKWPATVTTAEGSTISDAKKAVLKAISADRVQREKQAFARTKKCHDDFHVEEFKAAAYYTLVTKCVCGTKETNLADTPNTLAICDKLFEAATKPPSAAFTCADPP